MYILEGIRFHLAVIWRIWLDYIIKVDFGRDKVSKTEREDREVSPEMANARKGINASVKKCRNRLAKAFSPRV